MNQNCYVYKWTHLPTMKWYAGSRTRDTSHPNDGYICSSAIVKPMIESRPWEWRREIIDVGTKDKMRELEIEILRMFNAARDDTSFNRSNGNHGFYPRKGKVVSEKTRQRLSQAGRKRYQREKELGIKRSISEKHKESLSKANLGKKLSEEAKKIIGEKNSQNMKGKKLPRERVEKVIATRIRNGNHRHSEETKEKLRQAIKAKGPRPPEVIEKIKQAKLKREIKAAYFQPVITAGLYFTSITECAEYWSKVWNYSVWHTKIKMKEKFKNEADWIKLPKIKASSSVLNNN